MKDLARVVAHSPIVSPSGGPLDSVLRDDQNLVLHASESFASLVTGQAQIQTDAAVRIADIQARGAADVERLRGAASVEGIRAQARPDTEATRGGLVLRAVSAIAAVAFLRGEPWALAAVLIGVVAPSLASEAIRAFRKPTA